MRHNSIAAVFCALLALPLFAQPKITNIQPVSGSVIGQTAVTITGSGFFTCPVCSPPTPPAVAFGGVPASSVRLYDEFTIIAVAPPHLPGHADVAVAQWNGTATLPDAFDYFGAPGDAFDRVLLPIYLEPIHGQFGSEFRTAFETMNRGTSELPVYGLSRNCGTSSAITPCTNVDPLSMPAVMPQNGTSTIPRYKDGNPGRLLFVPRGRSADLLVNLRAFDVSRNLFSFGTQMPVVRDTDFREDKIVLLGVPYDLNFRNTLRIYADSSESRIVTVKAGDAPPVDVTLSPGADIFQPAIATFTAFPLAPTPVTPPSAVPIQTVVITMSSTVPTPAPQYPARIWAFVSSTNNTTQEITTITP